MPKVYTHTDRPLRSYSPTGDGTVKTYQEEIVDGVKTLTPTGFHNVYEEIQLDLESTKIENILHACMMGDFSALKAREGTYVDSTNMPKTLMEAQNLVLRLKQEFEQLPLEVRKEFNNSPEKYVDLMGTDEFKDIMAPYNEKIAAIREAGNLKEYEKQVKQQAKFEKDVAAAKEVKAE